MKVDLHHFDTAGQTADNAQEQAIDTAAEALEDANPMPQEQAADREDIDPAFADDPAWQRYEKMRNARFAAKSASLARSLAQTHQLYPAFDLQKELRNPRFMRLIDAGLSVRESYEVLHRDELLRTALAAAQEHAQRQVYRSLAARKGRVEENGASPALISRRDPAAMSRAQREQIAKRVMRGEKVTF
ncbi:MAG: hypothetical protein J6L88_00285 [Clostridia bacterium]|nr:hypothetical protein [Clostridia bacterium]